MNVKNIINGFVKEVINIKKKEIIKQFQKNNNLSDEDQRYLFGECDRWCLDHFEEGLQIVGI